MFHTRQGGEAGGSHLSRCPHQGSGGSRASPEVEVLECEVGFHDASGFDPGSEDILLGGLVVGGPDPIQAVQVAGDGNTQGPWNKPARPWPAPPGGQPWKRWRPPPPPPGAGVGGREWEVPTEEGKLT